MWLNSPAQLVAFWYPLSNEQSYTSMD
jgi:hypothetical protein